MTVLSLPFSFDELNKDDDTPLEYKLQANFDAIARAHGIANIFSSGSASSGQVLTANGSGGATWAAATPPITYPYTIDVDPWMSPAAQTNWSTKTIASTLWRNGYVSSSGAQNASIEWDVVLGAGTWTFEVLYASNPDTGIITVNFDGSSVGTIDLYAASGLPNVLGSVSGIVVAASGVKRVRLKMATKNASSSSYFGRIQNVRFRRTA